MIVGLTTCYYSRVSNTFPGVCLPRMGHVVATELKSVFPLDMKCCHVKCLAKSVNKIYINLDFKAK